MFLTVLAVEFFFMLSLGYIQIMPKDAKDEKPCKRFNDNVVRLFAAVMAVVALFFCGINLADVVDLLMTMRSGWFVSVIVILVGMIILAGVVYKVMFKVAKIGNTLFPDD